MELLEGASTGTGGGLAARRALARRTPTFAQPRWLPTYPRAWVWRGLALLWVAFLASLFFEPVPNPEAAARPLGDALGNVVVLAPLAAAVFGSLALPRVAFALSFLAAAGALVAAIAAYATRHQPALWWLVYQVLASWWLARLSVRGFAGVQPLERYR
jgi:hypothetical protein